MHSETVTNLETETCLVNIDNIILQMYLIYGMDPDDFKMLFQVLHLSTAWMG